MLQLEPRALSYFGIISQNLESPKLATYYYTDSKPSEGFGKGALSAEDVFQWWTTCLACAGLWVQLLEHPYPHPHPQESAAPSYPHQEEKLGD